MRQAGRYLPEYREVRAERRLVPRSLLQSVARRRGHAAADPPLRLRCGDPLLGHPRRPACARSGRPLRRERRAAARAGHLAGGSRRAWPTSCLSGVSRPCSRRWSGSRAPFPRETTLLGFCGAPWTVASYMIAGKGTPDQAPARVAAYRDPPFMTAPDRPARRGLDGLSDGPDRCRRRGRADLRELRRGAAAGAVPAAVARADRPHRARPEGGAAEGPNHRVRARRRARICASSSRPASPIASPSTGRSISRPCCPACRRRLATQGNLDPLALVAGGEALERGIDAILRPCAAARTSSISATASCRRPRSRMSSACWPRCGASDVKSCGRPTHRSLRGGRR